MNQLDFTRLERQLGYVFEQPKLLQLALSHRSVGQPNNERLEFLGDSILNFVVAEQLFEAFPEAREGQLTRLRANLVKGETLASIANELSLGEYVRLGDGERKSGGHTRASILADLVEAIIGAVYKESGLASAKALIVRLVGERIRAITLEDQHKDSKSALQEYLQSRQQPLPDYVLEEVDGEGHAQRFTVKCVVAGLKDAPMATDTSRKKAEKKAASLALSALNKQAGK
ncbi:ribonuclease III [Simiduia sp. 21SJ11W-1]|uniref:ribonuclease III n=1 Tax=Simiduia sp. 21SJ11W-1 TaxID=2909669 RepID=UPI00209C9C36|nr:ribonuclease III [Simiduia sp. 21SJ11W-1]UTA46283.1 ribonuclease III [Simiduia sp. 21SJ11W-1]